MQTTTVTLDENSTGEFTETLIDDGENDELLVCAPHGGHIEPGTAKQARYVAKQLGSCCTAWICEGTSSKSAFDEWHVPSVEISTVQFPLLRRIVHRGFKHVVSFHGCTPDKLIVGGRADFRTRVALVKKLAGGVDFPTELSFGGSYGGVSPYNIVNWLADSFGGLQVEQGRKIRDKYWKAVATTVADFFA